MAIKHCILFILIALLLLVLINPASAQRRDKFIEYLPRNEDMDICARIINRTIGEVNCPPAVEIFRLAAECNHCMDLKENCPDCCLSIDDPAHRAIRCSPNDWSDGPNRYNCSPLAFSSATCQPVNSCLQGWLNPDWDRICSNEHDIETDRHCQISGCPGHPDTRPNGVCRASGQNWRCSTNNLLPRFSGCTVEPGAQCTSPCSMAPFNLSAPSDYYRITHAPQPSGFNFLYQPTPEFIDCIGACEGYTARYDTCTNRVICCQRGTCPPRGFLNSCDDGACTSRVNWPGCDPLTAPICALRNSASVDCLLGGGGCANCFVEIDPSFFYRFVAKSRESMVLIWQIDAEPPAVFEPNARTDTFFFTKLEVRRARDNALVHTSMVHQKSLEAAFSVYCATNIRPEVLQQGEAYVARVYYFLPPIGQNLSMPINEMRIILVRVRD